jgi:hypothetical protein
MEILKWKENALEGPGTFFFWRRIFPGAPPPRPGRLARLLVANAG